MRITVLNLLFYELDNGVASSLGELEDLLLGIPGLSLDGPAGAAYRPGSWRHAATGAGCILDLGQAPLEDDLEHPPRRYAGWRALPFSVQIPLNGPHWWCVEALVMIEGLLAALPGVHALDCEDTCLNDESEPGPFPWSRPRLIASWERQRSVQCDGLPRPRMARSWSLMLWRYRRERSQGLSEHPALSWSSGACLAEGDVAHSAAIWPASGAWALPPVELVVVQRANEAGVVPAELLRPYASPDTTLPGCSLHIPENDVLRALRTTCELWPARRFTAPADADWRD